MLDLELFYLKVLNLEYSFSDCKHFISSVLITCSISKSQSLDSDSVFIHVIAQLRPCQYCLFWPLESHFLSSVLVCHSCHFSSQPCAAPATSFNNHFSEVGQNYETMLLGSIKCSCSSHLGPWLCLFFFLFLIFN